jgi:antitoxin component YwqK of YwqJK toxin-antitoxin module|tara:strand:+ start:156 stop:1124 length:969 start_codon:yes stop_codon:yes gene_type:complete
MYRKLLYNNDCVLNILTNTVIFNFEEDWKEYLEWGNSNIEAVRKDILIKNNKLLWNGGSPKEEITETGYISTLSDKVGNVVKRTTVSDDTTTTEVFHSDSIIPAKILNWCSTNIINACTYHLNGVLMNKLISSHDGNCITETYYDDNGIITKSITEDINLKTKLLKVFNEHGNLFTLTNYKNGILNGVHQSFDEDGKLEKEYSYYTNNKTQSIKYKHIYHNIPNGVVLSESYDKRSDGNYDVVDYFHGTELIRAKGIQKFRGSDTDLQNGIMLGKWVFYHSSGTKESEHIFLIGNNKLINNKLITSTIYYEDNTLNHSISHV